MLKLAARTLDVYDDLADMSVMKKIAARVADVELAAPDVILGLDDQDFALVIKTAQGGLLRKYPVHDANATKLSRAYFAEQQVLPREVAETVSAKLAAAEQRFKIAEHGLTPEAVAALQTAVAYVDAANVTLPKLAAWDTEVYGLTVGDKRLFPLHTVDLVKAAETRFPQTAAGLECHERFLYARNIAAQAEALGVKLAASSPVHNYTNDGVNTSALAVALDERKRFMKAAGLHTGILDQLYQAAGCPIEAGPFEHPEVFSHRQSKVASVIPVDRVIEVLQGIDKFAGISQAHYLKGLPDPYASCFKRAEAMSTSVVDGADLTAVDPAKLREAFNDEFAAEFEADPVGVYSHLPDPTKQVIRELASQGTGATADESKGNAQSALAPMYSNTAGTAW